MKKLNPKELKQKTALLLKPCKTKEEFHKWIKYFLGLYLPDQNVSRFADTNPLDMIWAVYDICVNKNNPDNILELLYVAGRGSGKTLGMAIAELMIMLHDERDIVHVGAVMSQATRCYDYIKGFLYNRKIKPLVMPPGVREDDRLLSKANMSESAFNFPSGIKTLEILPCTLKACPTTEQLISTSRGDIEAKEVVPGDMLDSPLGFIEVLDNQIKEKECLEVELEDGTIIRGTLGHKIWTDQGWIELQNLTEEHEVLKREDL